LFAILAAAAAVLGRKALLEHLGWAGPVLALGAAGLFVLLGAASRSAVPPTVAAAQLVDAVPGVAEAHVSGLLAVYQPAEAATPIGADQAGRFELDTGGLEGRVHRHLQIDFDRWQWENFAMPAGVRVGSFRHTARLAEPVEATARFGPDGLEGRLSAGPFQRLGDAIVVTPAEGQLAVRLESDGSFRAGSAEALAPGQFIASDLLNDEQRARQDLYAKVLAEPRARHLAGRSLLLAWADPLDLGFTLAPSARLTGTALLAVPLSLERTPPGTRVTVPAAFVDSVRLTEDGQRVRMVASAWFGANMRMRFQLPSAVLPLEVERVRLTLRVHAPGRDVTVNGFAGTESVSVHRVASPLTAERVEIDDPRLLRLDAAGGLSLNIVIGGRQQSEGKGEEPDAPQWSMDAPGLEVVGKVSSEW
jgi:hypothetical protein